jgi:hypothetical protein
VLDRVRGLVRAIEQGDEAEVQEAVLRVSRSRRWLAPLAFAVGAFAMLFDGVKLLFSNWRLTIVQVLPAMWIWLAMLDLKIHVLHSKSFIVRHGLLAAILVAAITAVTAAAFALNAVFAFAIAGPGDPPKIRPAFARARSHRGAVLGSGALIGLLLGLSAIVVPRWGERWFTLSMGIVIGVMMVCYVAVPSRLIGITPERSTRDKLAASAISGALGSLVCTPPYLLGRIGILMLGSHSLRVPGVILLAVGFTLEAGATSAVKAIKMSAKLAGAHNPGAVDPPARQEPKQPPRVSHAESRPANPAKRRLE